MAATQGALGTLNGIGQTLPNPELLLRPLQSREAITSSSIEGTYVTPQQLLMFELEGRAAKAGDDDAADQQEVKNYADALRHGQTLLETLPLCNRVIKEMHAILLSGVRGQNKAPGVFRKWQVQIGSQGRFVPPPGRDVERLMDELERYMNADDPSFDPLVRCFLIHYQFETIHPFGDGNGRVGRALLALMIARWHGHRAPWLYMSAYFERYRDEYMRHLYNVSTTGAWEEWIEFCLRGASAQAHDAIWRCKKLLELRGEFLARVRNPTARTHRIIESLFASPLTTITAVQRQFGISYPTARKDIELLVESGILAEIADRFPKSFSSREIMKIIYDEIADDASS